MKRVKLFIPACGPMRHRVCMYVCMYVCGCAVLTSCTREDMNDIVPNISAGSGTSVAFSITLSDSPSFNGAEGETRSCHRGEPLISEWVKVNSFDATRPVNRSGGEPEKYSLALMELYEDSVSTANTPKTRSIMQNGFYFRVIAFKKINVSPGYVFQCAADYTSGGGSAPVLRGGNMSLPMKQTYRFVAYSFNNNRPMGEMLNNYQWGTTKISRPISTNEGINDFITFVSGDYTANASTLTLPIEFSRKLCQINLQITGCSFTECKGAYIKGGGNNISWTVGAVKIDNNTSNSYSSDISNNDQNHCWNIVPFSGYRQITVHFNSIKFDGKLKTGLEVSSSSSLSLDVGKRYVMKVQVKKEPGINVPADGFSTDMGGAACQAYDKNKLSGLIWANGNLKSADNSKPYEWTTPADHGYYYTWMSLFTGGTTVQGNKDPCQKLDTGKYGSGWRTPTEQELESLSHCTDKQIIDGGMWFMHRPNGLFLRAAGLRQRGEGSGYDPTSNLNQSGYYWSAEASFSQPTDGYCLYFYRGFIRVQDDDKPYGYTVRCVKTKQ